MASRILIIKPNVFHNMTRPCLNASSSFASTNHTHDFLRKKNRLTIHKKNKITADEEIKYLFKLDFLGNVSVLSKINRRHDKQMCNLK